METQCFETAHARPGIAYVPCTSQLKNT